MECCKIWKHFSKNWRLPNRSNPENFNCPSASCWWVKNQVLRFLKSPRCWVKRKQPTESTDYLFKPETGKHDEEIKPVFIFAGSDQILLPFFCRIPFMNRTGMNSCTWLREPIRLSDFMEVPPMLSVFAWLTHHLGNSMFWIKFWPSLFGALNFILIGKIVISQGGKQFALFLLFCCFFFTVFLRVHFLFQPNFLEVFFYTVIALRSDPVFSDHRKQMAIYHCSRCRRLEC